jgi:uncharacterized membrane protein
VTAKRIKGQTMMANHLITVCIIGALAFWGLVAWAVGPAFVAATMAAMLIAALYATIFDGLKRRNAGGY